ncbi:MAG: dATP pyrophosphohydrolase [Steroidobacteraceae bacterium]
MADLSIVPVHTPAELKRFIRLPSRLFAADPNFVPQLEMERLDALRPGKNPYFEHAEAQFFLAVRDGRDVGRISAQIDRLAPDPQLGFFGSIAAIDDAQVFAALFAAAEGWLRQRGRIRVQGPFNLSINEETGLLIDGFDTPPMIFMAHDPRYAAARIEALGYAKAKDVIAYIVDAQKNFPEPVMRMIRRSEAGGVRIRHIDFKHIEAEFRLVMEIYNDAWSQNWGFVPFTEHEFTHMAKGLKPLLDPTWTAVAEYEGKPVAFAILLPNLNEVVRDFKGSLFPFNWLKLLLRLKRGVQTGRVPLMGVRRSFAGGLLGGMVPLAMIHSLQRHARPKGLQRAELSWILEDNQPMRRMIEALGATAYKTYRVYEKPLP